MTTGAEFLDYIDLNLNDPGLNAWDGSQTAYEPLDPGEYTLEIIEANVQMSKKGNPTLVLQYKVVSEGPMKDRETRQWLGLANNPGSRGRLKSVTDAAGVPRDDRGGFSAQALVGARIVATVAHEENEDTNAAGEKVMKTFVRVMQERPAVQASKPAPASRPGRATPPVNNGGQPPAARR